MPDQTRNGRKRLFECVEINTVNERPSLIKKLRGPYKKKRNANWREPPVRRPRGTPVPQASTVDEAPLSGYESVSDESVYEPSQSGEEEEDVENIDIPHFLSLPPVPFLPTRFKRKTSEWTSLIRQSGAYTWADGRHRCCHQDKNQPSILPSAIIDSSCCVLSYFNAMYYSPVVLSIVCQQHNILVPVDSLERHWKIYHGVAGRNAGYPLASLVRHVCHAFGISPEQSEAILMETLSKTGIPSQIPGLPSPVKSIQCPYCHGWFFNAKNLWHALVAHWGPKGSSPICADSFVKSAEITQSAMVQRYTCLMFHKGFSSRNSLQRVALPYDYVPQQITIDSSKSQKRAIEVSSRVTMDEPQYLEGFGWDVYIKNIRADLSALIQLNGMPCDRMASSWPDDSEGQLVEKGLIALSKFTVLYLEDANSRVNRSQRTIREAITSGCLARFRRFKKRSFVSYRYPAVRMIAMVVRCLLWKRYGREELLGMFRPKVTPILSELFLELYPQLKKGSEADMTIFGPIVHKILHYTYTTPTDIKIQVATATEQSIILSILTPEMGIWLSPEVLCNIFCRLQRTCFSTFLHTAWQGGISVDYEMEKRPAVYKIHEDDGDDSDDSGDEDEREDETEGAKNDLGSVQFPCGEVSEAQLAQQPLRGDVFELVSGNESSDNISLNASALDIVAQEGEEDQLMRILADLRKWTTPKPDLICTLMSRIIDCWVVVKPIAMTLPSKSGCSWAADGQSFSLTWGSIRARVINVEALRKQVVKEAHELTLALTNIVPEMNISAFSLSQLMDVVDDRISMFDQPQNIDVFAQYIREVWGYLGRYGTDSPDAEATSIYRGGTISRKPAQEFLARLQVVLRLILAQIYRTSGIPPRSWQAFELLFRSLGQCDRNLWLLRNCTTFLGNPRAKQLDRLFYEAFWALAPHLGIALIFYLGVYRPIEIEIMEALGIPTADHRHYIFVYTHKRPTLSSYVFTAVTVNETLTKGTTDELAYESRAYRIVMQSILDNQLCRLHDDAVHSLLQSASNEQSQHGVKTHDTTYALDEISHGPGMPLSSRNRQFGVSRAFQAWYGFIREDMDWSRYANYQRSDDLDAHKTFALDVARRIIIQHYHISEGSRAKCADRVAKIMQLKPFIFGERGLSATNGSWVTLGDEVLKQVSATVIYGTKLPSVLSYPPLGGFSVKQIAIAIVLIVVASDEWSTGNLVIFENLFTVGRHFDERLDEALKLVTEFKECKPSAWLQFCHAVHKFAAEHLTTSITTKDTLYLPTPLTGVYNIEREV